jgi:CDP-diacylglycerol---glycerol-3-phosphate 3-phosphatidyltransferase
VLPNLITLLRIPLLAIIIGMLYHPNPGTRFVAAGLIILLIFMDTLDGVVARATKQTSLLGSILDIAADRAVELVLWVVAADLDLIPIVVPLIVIARGVFVDALRAMAPAYGMAPFDLVQSRLGKLLVGSPWLRTPYGLVKAVAFFLLALQHAFAAQATAPAASDIAIVAQVATWLAVALCLVRGIPVLIEAPRQLKVRGSRPA